MVVFLIWDELEEVCGRKMGENAKIRHFLGKNLQVVPLQKSGTGTHWQCGTGTGTHYAEEEWYRYPLAVWDWYRYQ